MSFVSLAIAGTPKHKYFETKQKEHKQSACTHQSPRLLRMQSAFREVLTVSTLRQTVSHKLCLLCFLKYYTRFHRICQVFFEKIFSGNKSVKFLMRHLTFLTKWFIIVSYNTVCFAESISQFHHVFGKEYTCTA